MKRFLIYLLVIPLFTVLQGCDLDDDGARYYFETLEILSADFPESFEQGQIYRVDVTMVRPSNCHFFEGFDFFRTGDTNTERTVYAIGSVLDQNDCTELTEETITAYFDFEVLFSDTYVFKLYAGTDENGEDQFLIYEVPVTDLSVN